MLSYYPTSQKQVQTPKIQVQTPRIQVQTPEIQVQTSKIQVWTPQTHIHPYKTTYKCQKPYIILYCPYIVAYLYTRSCIFKHFHILSHIVLYPLFGILSCGHHLDRKTFMWEIPGSGAWVAPLDVEGGFREVGFVFLCISHGFVRCTFPRADSGRYILYY